MGYRILPTKTLAQPQSIFSGLLSKAKSVLTKECVKQRQMLFCVILKLIEQI